MKVMCEVCKKAEYSRLCDHATGAGYVTSIDFQELTKTCDKKMCNKCATPLWANCEVCPEHAIEVKNKLLGRHTHEQISRISSSILNQPKEAPKK